ncbi:hypothetical protein AXF42_Ash019747 [Apostasia shenzhenica]|uniref:SH3 domain-containing protein n=1 Tax=Apostasia shenzhenica TaxID=1088818 RepID=A0A2H9ZRR2_9ASPA|nr:hypothetical protein AXF42_Ash019747 [Apostasia shenzhenica]
MESIRKQASKLRDQVAKQQQAVLKQFSGRFGHGSAFLDEAELQCHQKLQMLYSSTKAAKHLQQNIARKVEALISVSSKQIEILRKLAQDCWKYGDEYQMSSYALARASSDFANSHNLIEVERENMLSVLGQQVYEPLRVMVMSAPLEDARHLTNHYERTRHDVEAQMAEVLKRQLRSRDVIASVESAAKLQHAESKLSELQKALSALGREATEAMLSVESQQQEVTMQWLLVMVDAERSFHQKAAAVLDKLYGQMVQIKQHTESASGSASKTKVHPPTANMDATGSNADLVYWIGHSDNCPADCQNANEDKTSFQCDNPRSNNNKGNVNSKEGQPGDVPANGQHDKYYVAEVIHSFDAKADGELSLSVGDYVIVRQVAPNGWSEGECRGKAGWFPSAYIEEREKAPASKVINLLSC